MPVARPHALTKLSNSRPVRQRPKLALDPFPSGAFDRIVGVAPIAGVKRAEQGWRSFHRSIIERVTVRDADGGSAGD
jgi:hypothetical protein